MTIKRENLYGILRTVSGLTSLISPPYHSCYHALPSSEDIYFLQDIPEINWSHISGRWILPWSTMGLPTHPCPTQWVCLITLTLPAPSAQGALKFHCDKPFQLRSYSFLTTPLSKDLTFSFRIRHLNPWLGPPQPHLAHLHSSCLGNLQFSQHICFLLPETSFPPYLQPTLWPSFI